MKKTKIDYVIVGQGLAGSWLALELLKREASILVVDQGTDKTSSLRAAGLYNPITGPMMTKTWRADELFPTLENDYRTLEKMLHQSFLNPIQIYRPFSSIKSKNDWEGRSTDSNYEVFFSKILSKSIEYENICDPHGGILVNYSGYVTVPKLLKGVKELLIDKGVYREEVFDYEKMLLNTDSINYGEIEAKKVVMCEGFSQKNPYWKLPFKPARGDIMDIECNLKIKHIVSQGIYIIPKAGRFTVGSTYDHTNLTFEPQEAGIKWLETRLRKLYKGNFKIIAQRAGVRPTSHDRKPYIGFHQKYKPLAVFNGFGTKGVSLIPYFARHFVDVLHGKNILDKEINIERIS